MEMGGNQWFLHLLKLIQKEKKNSTKKLFVETMLFDKIETFYGSLLILAVFPQEKVINVL